MFSNLLKSQEYVHEMIMQGYMTQFHYSNQDIDLHYHEEERKKDSHVFYSSAFFVCCFFVFVFCVFLIFTKTHLVPYLISNFV